MMAPNTEDQNQEKETIIFHKGSKSETYEEFHFSDTRSNDGSENSETTETTEVLIARMKMNRSNSKSNDGAKESTHPAGQDNERLSSAAPQASTKGKEGDYRSSDSTVSEHSPKKRKSNYNLRTKKKHDDLLQENSDSLKTNPVVPEQISVPRREQQPPRQARLNHKFINTNSPELAHIVESVTKTKRRRHSLPLPTRNSNVLESVLESVPATIPKASKKTATKEKRDALDPPTKHIHVKSGAVVRKFEIVARRTKELQHAVTWQDKIDQKTKPKFQPILMVYDEMIDDPASPINDRFFRDKGLLSIQVPADFDPKTFGAILERVGKDMKKGKQAGKDWKIAGDIMEFHQRLFGKKRAFRPNGNGEGKQQAAKNNWLFGRGYDCSESKKPKQPKKPKQSMKEKQELKKEKEDIDGENGTVRDGVADM